MASSRHVILINRCCCLALQVVYRLRPIFWFVLRPQMRGVNLALWQAVKRLVIEKA